MGLGLIGDLLDQSRINQPTWPELLRNRRSVKKKQKEFQKLIAGSGDFLSLLVRQQPQFDVQQLYIESKKKSSYVLSVFILLPVGLTLAVSEMVVIYGLRSSIAENGLLILFDNATIAFMITIAFSLSFLTLPVYFVVLSLTKKLNTINYKFTGFNGMFSVQFAGIANELNYANTQTTADRRLFTVYDQNFLVFYKMNGEISSTIDFTKLGVSEGEISQILNYIARFGEMNQVLQ